MAIATTVMTSPALEWVYPRAQILREQVPKSDASDPIGVVPVPTKREILLCVSDPTIGAPMVTLAAKLTQAGDGGVLVLRLLSVDKPSQYLTAAQPEEVQSALAAVEARGAELGLAVPHRSFPSTKPARDICRVADEEGVGLILLGSHRPLLQRTLLGGVVSEVVALADMPVGVLIDRGLERVERVLLAVDESADGDAAALIARKLQAAGASLTEWRGGDGDRTEGLLAESEKGYDLVVVGMNATWDLDPTPTPWHRERLADGIATTLLAVRAGDPVS
jgi:nucleotide-binding universal stress UspA family protein